MGRISREPSERLRLLDEADRLGASQRNLPVWIACPALDAGQLPVAERVAQALMSAVSDARTTHGECLDWPDQGQDLWNRAQAACGDDAAARALVRTIADHSYWRHWAHTILGVIALRKGEPASALLHLRESARVVGEPRLSSYGPSFRLARETCTRGEWEAVADYLGACAAFWNDARLKSWRDDVCRRQVPQFPDA
jgi:hypothetical protein